MNKVVYLHTGRFVYSFPETHQASKNIIHGSQEEYRTYREFVVHYYWSNFGIDLFSWWQTIHIKGRIIDDAKFALFMLNYPDHINKIAYE
jgi:hypothetical protein